MEMVWCTLDILEIVLYASAFNEGTLTSVITYHMTVFPLSKWAIKKIDKIRCSFLWQGNEDARGGHCLVNWKQVQWPDIDVAPACK